MGSDTIDTYNKNFLRLSTQLTDLRVQDALFHYIHGLSERLMYEVKSKNPHSMEEVLQIATQYEHLHARSSAEVNTISIRNRHNKGNHSGS